MTDSFAGATSGVLRPVMNSTFKIDTLEVLGFVFVFFYHRLDSSMF